MKVNSEIRSLSKAYDAIYKASDATFFLAINYYDEKYFDKYFEAITFFREFFSIKVNHEIINGDVSQLLVKMAEVHVQKIKPKDDLVKKCFEVTHELDRLKKIVNDKISKSNSRRW